MVAMGTMANYGSATVFLMYRLNFDIPGYTCLMTILDPYGTENMLPCDIVVYAGVWVTFG
jgi:hypothetical protein